MSATEKQLLDWVHRLALQRQEIEIANDEGMAGTKLEYMEAATVKAAVEQAVSEEAN